MLRVETTGNKPSARHAHITAIRKKIYLFGGMDGKMYASDNKLYVLDTGLLSCVPEINPIFEDTLQWSEVPVSGSPPMPRMFHVFTSHRNQLFVFGGQGFNDLFQFDLGTSSVSNSFA